MNNSEEDPDFTLEVETGRSTVSSTPSSTRLLRSAGHDGLSPGLQFNSRISPSPSHSSIYRRRRRLRHQSGRTESEAVNTEERVGTARRDLSEDLARVERTSGWVANLHPFMERRTLNLVSSRRITSEEEHFESTVTKSHEVRMAQGEMTMTFTTPTPPKSQSLISETSSRSPRLKFFDGDQWKRSPRTGYTYIQSPTYRDNWTPEREVPMPHMARWPIDKHPKAKVNLLEAFSDDEDMVTERKKVSTKKISTFTWYLIKMYQITRLVLTGLFVIAPTKVYSRIVPSIDEIVTIIKKTTYILHDKYIWTRRNVGHESSTIAKTVSKQVWKMFQTIIYTLFWEIPSTIVPLLGPAHIAGRLPSVEAIESNEEDEEEILIIRRSVHIYHDRYKTKNISDGVSQVLGRVMKLALNAPKTLLLLLVPTLLTNASATETFGELGHQQGPSGGGPVVIENQPLNRLVDHLPDVSSWTKRSSSFLTQVRTSTKVRF